MAQNVGQAYRVTLQPGGRCCDVTWVHTEVGWRVGGTTGEEYELLSTVGAYACAEKKIPQPPTCLQDEDDDPGH